MIFAWKVNHLLVNSVTHLHIETAPYAIQGTSAFCSEWKTQEELNAALCLSAIKSIRRPNWSACNIRRSTIPNSVQGKRLARAGSWLSASFFVIPFSNAYSLSVELFSELFPSSTASCRESRSLYSDFHRNTLFLRFQMRATFSVTGVLQHL